ncbi:hypothetical protein QE152_g18947 [Popillia japonica]|uniref:Small nuclear ribonucleoprotein Sm D3 n=1 Tax=Popillia japonica TaxID=7064 RepID=A0AAW1L4A7_POPJA
MSIGVPIKVLHEAEGHIVTCETITGEVYRVTYRDGRVAQLENVYIRGSKIRFLILPDMLKNAPMFKKQTKSGTAGRGKSAILRAQAARGRGRAAAPAVRGGRGGSWQPGAQQSGGQGGRGR